MKLVAMPLFSMLAVVVAACGSESIDEREEGVDEAQVAETEQQLPSREFETTFYSNASKTVEVGYRIYTCYGPPTTIGQTTVYQTTIWGETCSTGTTTGGGDGCCYSDGQCPAECSYCTTC